MGPERDVVVALDASHVPFAVIMTADRTCDAWGGVTGRVRVEGGERAGEA